MTMNHSMQLALRNQLRTGDLLYSPLTVLNMAQHLANFWGYYDGHAWMAENLEGQGVVYTRFDRYLSRVGRVNAIR